MLDENEGQAGSWELPAALRDSKFTHRRRFLLACWRLSVALKTQQTTGASFSSLAGVGTKGERIAESATGARGAPFSSWEIADRIPCESS